jgi:hypothetical protein
MRGDPLASGKYLDGKAGEPDLDLGAGDAPFGEHVGLDWQWFERGLVEFFERLAPRHAETPDLALVVQPRQ